MRALRRPLVGLLLLPASFACSSPPQGGLGAGGTEVGTGGAGGSGGSSATVGTGGTGGAVGTGGTVVTPVTCMFTNETSDATCAAGPCPILLDVEETCDVPWQNAQVVPAADATWVVTRATNELVVYRVTATEQQKVDGVPADFAGTGPMLAIANDGTLHFAADTSKVIYPQGKTTYIGGLTHATLANGVWSSSIIVPNVDGNGIRTRGLQVAPDGVPRVWFISSLYVPHPPFVGYSVATPSASGWTLTEAQLPGGASMDLGGGRNAFTLAADGSIVSLALESAYPGDRLYALVGGAARTVGSVLSWGADQSFIPSYTFTPAPVPGAPSGLLFAAALADAAGIRVVGESASAPETEILVPGTQPPTPTCPAPDYWSCSGTCHETGAGMQSYALAWTDDGVAWLAYVVTQLDQMIQFVPEGSPDSTPETCSIHVTQDHSTATLHIVRVTLDGQPATEVLAMPMATPAGVASHGFAKDLALGLSTSAGTRVMRLDTTKL
jgi:hypothetical protein